jgi:MFS-type transporter involved in bile tolerance (Atg22 family)
MMVSVFGTLLLAFVLDLAGHSRLAMSCLCLSFALGVGLFLWEVYSPDYGFRMPWLQL